MNQNQQSQIIVKVLRDSGTEVLMNYLPVGSGEATRFYSDCPLEVGVTFVNNIPGYIASNPLWAKRFEDKNILLVGDHIKAQMGATNAHRILTDLLNKGGAKLERTYQLNVCDNADFLNILNRVRLTSRKKSRTEAVQAVAAQRLENEKIRIGKSDYIAWQKDNKTCFIRMEDKLFGNVPMHLEMREDSPNSAELAINSIRCAKLALDRKKSGILTAPDALFCKHPPKLFTDDEAYTMTKKFI